MTLSLPEKCTYSELFWSAFSCIQTEYGEIFRVSLYSVQIRENTDQNNSECGYFLRSVFFSSFLWALSVGIFHFCFSRPSKFNSMGSPSLHYVLVYNIHTCMLKITLSSLLTSVSFFYVKCANLLYITSFAPNLIKFGPDPITYN